MPNNTGSGQYDDQGRLYYDIGGHRSYVSPAVRGGQRGPNGETDQAYALPTGGGILHGRPGWNQDTGKVESGLDWGNILSMVAAGILTAGVADALMSAPAGTAQAMIDSGAGGSGGGVGTGVHAGLLGPSMESAADVSGAAAGGGSSWPSWLTPTLKAAVPAAYGLASRFGGSSGSGTSANGLDPTMSANVNDLLAMVTHRLKSTEPIHDAAMAMAQRMAPTGGDNPRLNAAIDRTTQPQSPQSSLNPQVAEAIRRLMGGQ